MYNIFEYTNMASQIQRYDYAKYTDDYAKYSVDELYQHEKIKDFSQYTIDQLCCKKHELELELYNWKKRESIIKTQLEEISELVLGQDEHVTRRYLKDIIYFFKSHCRSRDKSLCDSLDIDKIGQGLIINREHLVDDETGNIILHTIFTIYYNCSQIDKSEKCPLSHKSEKHLIHKFEMDYDDVNNVWANTSAHTISSLGAFKGKNTYNNWHIIEYLLVWSKPPII